MRVCGFKLGVPPRPPFLSAFDQSVCRLNQNVHNIFLPRWKTNRIYSIAFNMTGFGFRLFKMITVSHFVRTSSTRQLALHYSKR